MNLQIFRYLLDADSIQQCVFYQPKIHENCTTHQVGIFKKPGLTLRKPTRSDFRKNMNLSQSCIISSLVTRHKTSQTLGSFTKTTYTMLLWNGKLYTFFLSNYSQQPI